MLSILKFFWYIIWSPGYIILAAAYYFPTEWGKKRNVTITARHWNKRHIFAPWYTICLLFLLLLLG